MLTFCWLFCTFVQGCRYQAAAGTFIDFGVFVCRSLIGRLFQRTSTETLTAQATTCKNVLASHADVLGYRHAFLPHQRGLRDEPKKRMCGRLRTFIFIWNLSQNFIRAVIPQSKTFCLISFTGHSPPQWGWVRKGLIDPWKVSLSTANEPWPIDTTCGHYQGLSSPQ